LKIGSCAARAFEPRQVREEAAVRRLLKRCGNGKGYLIGTQSVSVRPSGLHIMRAEV
jgi:hypothetical protein